jgi:hypothetical protein
MMPQATRARTEAISSVGSGNLAPILGFVGRNSKSHETSSIPILASIASFLSVAILQATKLGSYMRISGVTSKANVDRFVLTFHSTGLRDVS